ncbi:SLAC1 anion channel family protein [Caenispirillum salinarum]|uniref:SLAC1 anion channel family protein n=1 Tax=Caenispirillum salinarum TaxID=859058 RepID=UPI00384E633B
MSEANRPDPVSAPADAGTGTAPAGAIPAATSAVGPWLMHVPVPLFAVVMGVTGLGIAWRKAAHTVAAPAMVGEAIMALAAVLFVAITVLYAIKALRFPQAVKKEFAHPIRANFFPAFSIAILLLSIGAIPHAPTLALWMWTVGAVLHITLTVTLLKRWILHDIHIAHSNPAWFIPIVGNIIVPLTGSHFGFTEVAWFFFSIGVVFWLVLMTLLIYRIIFHDPMPAKILPTLFIFMAPPAVGYLSYMALTDGVVDGFARVLIYTGLFIALLLLSMTRTFLKVPFAVSWWAFTFPSAALACAVLDYGARVGAPAGLTALGWGLLGLATVIIATVFIRTTVALVGGHLFVPE